MKDKQWKFVTDKIRNTIENLPENKWFHISFSFMKRDGREYVDKYKVRISEIERFDLPIKERKEITESAVDYAIKEQKKLLNEYEKQVIKSMKKLIRLWK